MFFGGKRSGAFVQLTVGTRLQYIRIWWSELAGAAETLLAIAVEYVL